MRIAIVVAAIATGLAVLACGSDRPEAAGAADTPSAGPGAIGDGGGTTEASADVVPALCVTRSGGAGASVAEVDLGSDPPAPLGGPVSPGAYDVSEVYGSSATDAGHDDGEGSSTRLTGRYVASTLFVSGNTIEIIEATATDAATNGPESTRGFYYAVDDTSLLATEVCPSKAPTVSLPYSAVGNGLAIYFDATHWRVYTLRP